MNPHDDPFVAFGSETLTDDFGSLAQRPMAALTPIPAPTVVLGRLHGFDLLEQPLIAQLDACPGQVLAARSTVSLRKAMVGRQVIVMFEQGDTQRPIMLGVIEPHPLHDEPLAVTPSHVEVDGERRVIEAEREIVLRCGDASITLTRAGRVIIRGSHILSRSAGYNKIKGAAIDIN